jgi:hypothetical protein
MTPILASAALLAATLLPTPGILTPTPTPEPEATEQQVGGSTHARDRVLRRGCRPYHFSYAVSTPYDDWTLETTVVDPRGKGVASGALIGPSDPRTGEIGYTLCRRATTSGRFTITGKLISYDGMEETVVQLPTSTFRLRRHRPAR